jgi:hypothetical protein
MTAEISKYLYWEVLYNCITFSVIKLHKLIVWHGNGRILLLGHLMQL